MRQRSFIAILTVVVFLAGYGTRVWTEPDQIVPPPPAALAREYAGATASTGGKKREVDRARLVADIQKLRPQIDAYSAQVQEIEAEFDREFAALLTPGQREKFSSNQKKRAEGDAKRLANRTPLSDEELMRERDRPLTSIYWKVTVTPMLEGLTKEYSLDAGQQSSARNLLALRRNKYIALFDSTPHPSIRLSRLAPAIERVGVPAK
jgi:hypothetical protein